MAVATSFFVASAIAAGATAGSSIYAANKQSGAAKEAAKTQSNASVKTAQIQSDSANKSAQIQSDSANKSAELQAGSAREALDYSRGQSQLSLDQYNQQQVRLQPYRNLGNFALGLPNEAAPAPLQLPSMQSSGQQSSRALPKIDPSKPIGPQAEAYITAQGGTPAPTSGAYWDAKWAELTARGNEIGDPNYALKRLAAADELGGGGGSAPTSSMAPTARQPVTLGYKPTATPFVARPPMTAPLQTPQLRYRPLGSIGDT